MDKNDGKTFSEEACPACGNLRADAQRLAELEQINSQWQNSACEKGADVLALAFRIKAIALAAEVYKKRPIDINDPRCGYGALETLLKTIEDAANDIA